MENQAAPFSRFLLSNTTASTVCLMVSRSSAMLGFFPITGLAGALQEDEHPTDYLLGSDQGKRLNQRQKHRSPGGEIDLKRAILGSKMRSQAMGHGLGDGRGATERWLRFSPEGHFRGEEIEIHGCGGGVCSSFSARIQTFGVVRTRPHPPIKHRPASQSPPARCRWLFGSAQQPGGQPLPEVTQTGV